MNKPMITVVGSANMDLVMKVPRFPQPGETLPGGKLSLVCGGKGANQAVALARLGANVEFIGCIGKKGFGNEVVSIMKSEGIVLDNLKITEDVLTGTVLILVTPDGEHIMVPDYGANLRLLPDDINEKKDVIRKSSLIMLQFEILEETNLAVVDIAKKYGIPYIVNPAPLLYMGAEIIKGAEVLVPNLVEALELAGSNIDLVDLESLNGDYPEVELEKLYGIGDQLMKLGPKHVVITLGRYGCVYVSRNVRRYFDVFRVEQVDVTGAGDGFNAGLAYKLSCGSNIEEAIRFASAVGAITVTRLGAQTSFPNLKEVNDFLKKTVD